ncbi:MAG: ATP-dependent Clp protease proteolytic subunit, partial [Rickettsiales bacterium]|nr:ATP-dependent Clp protease proteolytic subunit [Rickettsiales bacterium]
HAREIIKTRERLNLIYARHTGRSAEEISAAVERDNFMTAEEALAFGLVDKVVAKREDVPQ